MLTEPREPKYLQPYTCPMCGEKAEANEVYHKNNADFWRFTCPACGCEFKQWTATEDLPPTSLELDGVDHPLESEPSTLRMLDDSDAVGVVVGWLQRMAKDVDRKTNLECIVAAMDKATRQHIGEVFFDVDSEVGADEET